MRALPIQRGRPDQLVEEDGPAPTPTIGDALIRVYADSFTPTELDWPSMWAILGHEVSGVVTALGWGTTGVSVGGAVYGLTDWYRDGTAAEYVDRGRRAGKAVLRVVGDGVGARLRRDRGGGAIHRASATTRPRGRHL